MEKLSLESVNNIEEFEVIKQDPYLGWYREKIRSRVKRMLEKVNLIEKNEESFVKFCESYEHFGVHVREDAIYLKEYAPGAHSLSIVIVLLK